MNFSNNTSARHIELVRILLRDFMESFPNSNRAERVEIHSRLTGMSEQDLEILASQLTKKVEVQS